MLQMRAKIYYITLHQAFTHATSLLYSNFSPIAGALASTSAGRSVGDGVGLSEASSARAVASRARDRPRTMMAFIARITEVMKTKRQRRAGSRASGR